MAIDPYIKFPFLPGVGFPVMKVPKFGTRIQTSVSGRELRILDRPLPVWTWTLPFEFLRDMWDVRGSNGGRGQFGNFDELRTLMGTFTLMQGQFGGFAFWDTSDNHVFGQPLANTISGIGMLSGPAFPGQNVLSLPAPVVGMQIGDMIQDETIIGGFQPFTFPTYVTGFPSPFTVSINPPIVLPTGPNDIISWQRPIVMQRTFLLTTENVGFVTGNLPGVPTVVQVNGLPVDPLNFIVDNNVALNQRLTFRGSTLPMPGSAVTASFSYYFYVRFAEDSTDFSNFLWQIWEAKAIKLQSILQ
jgi:hypothetical protein